MAIARPTSSIRRLLGALLMSGVLGAALIGAQTSTGTQPDAKAPAATTPPAPSVVVNRSVPKVTSPAGGLALRPLPSLGDIVNARLFREPLVPVGGVPTDAENAAFGRALMTFAKGSEAGSDVALRRFLTDQPGSPWRASLLLNLGGRYRSFNAYARALASWEEAWKIASVSTDAAGKAVADLAMAEWLLLQASLGQSALVQGTVERVKSRAFTGQAASKLGQARELADMITAHPEKVVASGPQALSAILRHQGRPDASALAAYRPTAAGTSLLQLRELAASAGLTMRVVFRESATEAPVPAVVHWKVGHYSAVVERNGHRYRIVDNGFAGTYWVSRDTLFDEASGYFLVANDASLDGWQVASEAAAGMTLGRSCPSGGPRDTDCGKPCCKKPPPGGGGCGGGGCPSFGMVTYDFNPVNASLQLEDSPVGYAPTRGPAIYFRLTYFQRDSRQPQIFSSANLGPKWRSDWLRALEEVPTGLYGTDPPRVVIDLPGMAQEVHTGPNAEGVYPTHWRDRATLVRVQTSPARYERRLTDGTVEVFAAADNAPVGQRRVFLTQIVDPLGQAVSLTWDAQLRLIAITDAIGQVTTMSYSNAAAPLQVTGVTDPFGRTATFAYNSAGQLASITDVIGLTSHIAYGPEDFVTAITTPYGRTSFRKESADTYVNRFIEATDPLGGTERLEYRWATTALTPTVPASEVPSGFETSNAFLDDYNTFYWDKLAWSRATGDPAAATVTKWLVSGDWPGATAFAAGVPHSVKRPLEARVWYAYPGQSSPASAGTHAQTSRVGRVLDDGTSQISEATYNPQGSVLTRTDPLGRRTTSTYAANGRDLLDVRQTTGGMNDLLANYGSYTALGQPQTITDAAGQTTSLTYNAAGQVLTVTNAKNETTTYLYDGSGRLSSVTGAVAGATTSYTYDALNRPRTVTDADGVTLTTDYDAFDRPTRVTYPDSTYEAIGYDRLDVSTRRDRAGRVTRYSYDALRRLLATRDPAGRVVGQEWCRCGSLDALIDANGNRTSWERDLQGRVTREVRADGVTDTSYTYGPRSGRLLTVTDPKDQVTTYTYAADEAVLSTTYTNALISTPSVSHTYDSAYRRLATMTDGTGLTTYTYHPVGQLGAGQVASVDGPLTADTITYAYDPLGRVTTRGINGVGVTWAFDALGRVTSETNVLGAFGYTYEESTGRVATVTYPNSQTSTYAYFGSTADRRLQTIHHRYPGGATLSKFDYTYDIDGNIVTWRQQADSGAVLWGYQYDAAGQLVSAVKHTTDAVPTVLKRYVYRYDPAGNRTSEQIDDQVTGATYDAFNRLLTQQPSGALTFGGTVNEPSTVTVQGTLASVTAANAFSASVAVATGTTTIAVTATDSSGNTATKQYEIDSLGAGRTLTYDANGNLTSDGTRTFDWDARNQLVAINLATHRSEFTYDGQQRRVRIVEKESGVIQTDTMVLWCDKQICEEREVAGTAVARRAFGRGEQVGGNARFFAADHLGSVTEVSDGSATLLGRYAFDPWGRRTVVGGTDVTSVGFTGHQRSLGGLLLSLYRAYDPHLGRWISEDPLKFVDGPNTLAYVQNNPTGVTDPLGLSVKIRCEIIGGKGFFTDLGLRIANARHCYLGA